MSDENIQQPDGNSPDDALSGQPAKFAPLTDTAKKDGGGQQNLNLILDIDVEVTVELGRSVMQIKEVLDMAPGSVIELNKLAGETVDVFVNKSLIAKGEVVVINENFGVRITEIIGAAARIQNLGKTSPA